MSVQHKGTKINHVGNKNVIRKLKPLIVEALFTSDKTCPSVTFISQIQSDCMVYMDINK